MAHENIEGMRELIRTFQRMGRMPQTVATQAARAGASVAYRAAKREAPVDTGELKNGLILKRERRVKPGKAVYDVMPDPAKNDIFVKISKAGKRAYYPASQEYGFLTVNGGYVPGYRYLKKSMTGNAVEIERKTIEKAKQVAERIMERG